MERKSQSPWRIPLVRELTLVLIVKLVLLLGIKAIWFDAPTLPDDGTQRVAKRLLGHLPQYSESSMEALSHDL